jgi:hypothetical protein
LQRDYGEKLTKTIDELLGSAFISAFRPPSSVPRAGKGGF